MGAGSLGALTYYALAPAIGAAAVFAAWATVWLLLSVGQGRLAQAPPRPWARLWPAASPLLC